MTFPSTGMSETDLQKDLDDVALTLLSFDIKTISEAIPETNVDSREPQVFSPTYISKRFGARGSRLDSLFTPYLFISSRLRGRGNSYRYLPKPVGRSTLSFVVPYRSTFPTSERLESEYLLRTCTAPSAWKVPRAR